MKFQNPSNGYVESVSLPFVWTLFFGEFYFAVRGVWTHFVVGLLLAVPTMGVSWLLYPFFAAGILRSHYLRQGWKQIE